jgi:hypothetical protein
MLDPNQINTIIVEVRDVYGQSKIYPVCGEAQIFAEIAGTKTLLPKTIQLVKMLGYEVKVKQQEVTL